MEVYTAYQCFKSKKPTLITIGMFDGVHCGHQKILKKMVKESQELGLESLVFTFSPHPRYVLEGENSSFKMLSTLEEKQSLLENVGIEHLVIQNFTDSFSNLSPEDYVKEVLVESLQMKKIIIGHDHRFGKDRKGTFEDLVALGTKYGFEVEQVDAKEIKEITVSSTKIRHAIADGKIKKANELLGRAYAFEGVVVEGKKLGRTIGFPTANIQVDDEKKMLPKKGVYVVEVFIDSTKYRGMMNIGNNPTVSGKMQTIEVHILDFSESIYGKKVSIGVLDFIREEKKFDSLEGLKKQLESDKEYTKNYM